MAARWWNHSHWEAQYGVRVVVHDGEKDGVRFSRVGIWHVPEPVRDAALAFRNAVAAYKNAPTKDNRTAVDKRGAAYVLAKKGMRAPAAGAMEIGMIKQQPDGTWAWWHTDTPEQENPAASLNAALTELVTFAMGPKG